MDRHRSYLRQFTNLPPKWTFIAQLPPKKYFITNLPPWSFYYSTTTQNWSYSQRTRLPLLDFDLVLLTSLSPLFFRQSSSKPAYWELDTIDRSLSLSTSSIVVMQPARQKNTASKLPLSDCLI
jgi:hypothetical protein